MQVETSDESGSFPLTQKMQVLSSFTHIDVDTNSYDFLENS